MAFPFFKSLVGKPVSRRGTRLVYHELHHVPNPLSEAGALAIFEASFHQWGGGDGIRDGYGSTSRRLRTVIEETGVNEVPGEAGGRAKAAPLVSGHVLVSVNADLMRNDHYDNGSQGAHALIRTLETLIRREFGNRLREAGEDVRVYLVPHDGAMQTVLFKLGPAARLPGDDEAPSRQIALTLHLPGQPPLALNVPPLLQVTDSGDGLLDLTERPVAIYANTRHLMFAANQQAGIAIVPELGGLEGIKSFSIDVRRRKGVLETSSGHYREVEPQTQPDGSETYLFETDAGLQADPAAGPAGLVINVSTPTVPQMQPTPQIRHEPPEILPVEPIEVAPVLADDPTPPAPVVMDVKPTPPVKPPVNDETIIISPGREVSTLCLAVAFIALPCVAPDNGQIKRWTLRFDVNGRIVNRANVPPRDCLQLCATTSRPELFLAPPGATAWQVATVPGPLQGTVTLLAPPAGLEDRYHALVPVPDAPMLLLPPQGGVLGRAGAGDADLVVGLLTQPGSLVLAGEGKDTDSFMERVALSRRHLHLSAAHGHLNVRMANGATPAWHIRFGEDGTARVIATLAEVGAAKPGSLQLQEGDGLLVGPYLFVCKMV